MTVGQPKEKIEFTAHNIKLDDGTFTRPESTQSMTDHPWFISSRGVLETVFPGDKSKIRVADLGCLEGGYAVEFARLGFKVLGVEVRESNIAACNYVKSRTNLPNLEFVQDDAFNIAKHGVFDAVFCCGLLYHLDRPKEFLEAVSVATNKLLILQTHFSLISRNAVRFKLSTRARWFTDRILRRPESTQFVLSAPTKNEGLAGRWYTEFQNNQSFKDRESAKWASWDNRRSFWIQREHLLQTIHDVGFDLVMEQYDNLEPNIAEGLLGGSYESFMRGTFIGIKTGRKALT
ncbi:class I SAM-dependent methyltransferase [Mycobacterium senriense]|uniref:Methyltransferase domain-containing protein n=1 Tax=Mycobacterium senriense TaxID=2775496 RepID=A0ABM7SXB2_9MYCO|nr:class I SAM-dependent methyltransferase [Mycobacterium senriense]BCZ24969.1 hypothetical protein MTY59_48240 [Mycobacterium senriense]